MFSISIFPIIKELMAQPQDYILYKYWLIGENEEKRPFMENCLIRFFNAVDEPRRKLKLGIYVKE